MRRNVYWLKISQKYFFISFWKQSHWMWPDSAPTCYKHSWWVLAIVKEDSMMKILRYDCFFLVHNIGLGYPPHAEFEIYPRYKWFAFQKLNKWYGDTFILYWFFFHNENKSFFRVTWPMFRLKLPKSMFLTVLSSLTFDDLKFRPNAHIVKAIECFEPLSVFVLAGNIG